MIRTFLKNKRGAAAVIEYSLIAALIAVAAITAIQGLGDSLASTFNTTSSVLAASA